MLTEFGTEAFVYLVSLKHNIPVSLYVVFDIKIENPRISSVSGWFLSVKQRDKQCINIGIKIIIKVNILKNFKSDQGSGNE